MKGLHDVTLGGTGPEHTGGPGAGDEVSSSGSSSTIFVTYRV